MALLKVRIAQALVSQDTGTKLLVPPAGGASVYLAGTNTLATLYSNSTGSPLSNPVPTGVTPGSSAVGITTDGNIFIWVDVPGEYEVLVSGERIALSTVPVHNIDVVNHMTNATPDPHGDRQWALGQFVQLGGASNSGWVWGP